MAEQPLFVETERVVRAIRQAVRAAVREHKLLGHSVVTVIDGEVAWVAPEDIEIPDDDDDDPPDALVSRRS